MVQLPPRSARRRAAAVITLAASLLALPAGAQAADLPATTANFSTVFSSAQAGDTVVLAAGSYGTFRGAVKTGMVTIRPADGATVSMGVNFRPAANITLDGIKITGLEIGDSRSKNITVRNSSFDQAQAIIRTGDLVNSNVLLDHNTHVGFVKCSSCGEGRIWLPENTSQPSGVTIQNSYFAAGNSDGIQNGGNGVRILNNEFADMHQTDGAAGVHTDSIQLYGSRNTVISGNWMHNVADCIMAPDGTDHEVIMHNVCTNDGGNAFGMDIESDVGSVIQHNTLTNSELRLGNKSGDPASTGTIVKDNIFRGISIPEGRVTYGDEGYNLSTVSKGPATTDVKGTPVYVGPTTTFAGWALAAGSPGAGTASDGTDRGANVTGTTPPPPPPPPPGDTTPPDTSIVSGPSGSTAATDATLGFTSTEAGSTFECKLDTGAYVACTSPWAYSGLAVGQHTFSVRAKDAAANTDASPATRTWTVSAPPDTTAPDTAVMSGPAASTMSTSASLQFSSTESGSTFQCRIDGGAYATCTSPKAYADLALGAHTFNVRARDAAGNVDATPAAWTWTIVATPPPPDTTAPNTSITSGPSGSTTAIGATFAFTSTEENSSFECRLDGGAYALCGSPIVYDELAPGSHTFSVRAKDAAGNTDGSPANRTWTVTAPNPPTGGSGGTPNPPSGGGTPTTTLPVAVVTGPAPSEASATTDRVCRARTGSVVSATRLRLRRTATGRARVRGTVPEAAISGSEARIRLQVRGHGRWTTVASRRVKVSAAGRFTLRARVGSRAVRVRALVRGTGC